MSDTKALKLLPWDLNDCCCQQHSCKAAAGTCTSLTTYTAEMRGKHQQTACHETSKVKPMFPAIMAVQMLCCSCCPCSLHESDS
jgi:hypothetical protein